MRMGLGLALTRLGGSGGAAGPNRGVEIVARTNTAVTTSGTEFYRVNKNAGIADYNADAVSVSSIAGQFVLRIRLVAGNTESVAVGVDANPTAAADHASLDYAVLMTNTGDGYAYEGGFNEGFMAAISGDWWIFRDGSNVITYRRGATYADAVAAAPDRTSPTPMAAAAWFDCSIYPVNGNVDVKFGTPADFA